MCVNMKISSTRSTSETNLVPLRCELVFVWKWFSGRQNVWSLSLGFVWFFTSLDISVISSSFVRFHSSCNVVYVHPGCYIVKIWRGGFPIIRGMFVKVYSIYVNWLWFINATTIVREWLTLALYSSIMIKLKYGVLYNITT